MRVLRRSLSLGLSSLLLVSDPPPSQADRYERVLVPRRNPKPKGEPPFQARPRPNGHKALRRDLRDRGLSGLYIRLIFDGEALPARSVTGFWWADGTWHYRVGALEHLAMRLIVFTLEGRAIEIAPTKAYRAPRLVAEAAYSSAISKVEDLIVPDSMPETW